MLLWAREKDSSRLRAGDTVPAGETVALANPADGPIIVDSPAKETLGIPFFVCPVAQRIIRSQSQSLSKEVIVAMRSIFEKDPLARTDINAFIKHVVAEGAAAAQAVNNAAARRSAASAAGAEICVGA